MCQPVTATGSLWRQAYRLITVPTAMAKAAANIHSSPWLQARSPRASGPISHHWRSTAAGRPRQRIPSRPSSSPSQPTGLIASPNRLRASRATSSGWESISTDPRPAPVPPRPRANRPWKAVASTRANSNSQPQSRRSTAIPPRQSWAASSTTPPAGSNRNQARVRGPAPSNSGFIAAIAVPHRAKGNSINSQRNITGFSRPRAPF